MLEGMVEAAGLKADIDLKIGLGQSVDYHFHDPVCWAKIKEKKWDYIIIQDNQRYYCDRRGLIDSFDYTNHMAMRVPLLENNIHMQDSIKKLDPGVKIIYFAGWEKCGGEPERFPGDSTKKMIARILANYKYMNDQPGVHNLIAPVGAAFIKCMNDRPYMAKIPLPNDTAFNLYDHDGRHPGNATSYLSACVIYVMIFHRSPIGLQDSVSNISASMNAYLKQVAWQTVLDSFSYTNLAVFCPVVKKARKMHNALYTTNNYASYQWFYEEDAIAGATAYKFEAGKTCRTGNYRVETKDKKGNLYRSFPFYLKCDVKKK